MFLEDLAKSQVLQQDLTSAYQAMAKDKNREQAALDWSESLISDVSYASQ